MEDRKRRLVLMYSVLLVVDFTSKTASKLILALFYEMVSVFAYHLFVIYLVVLFFEKIYPFYCFPRNVFFKNHRCLVGGRANGDRTPASSHLQRADTYGDRGVQKTRLSSSSDFSRNGHEKNLSDLRKLR